MIDLIHLAVPVAPVLDIATSRMGAEPQRHPAHVLVECGACRRSGAYLAPRYGVVRCKYCRRRTPAPTSITLEALRDTASRLR